MLFLFVHIVGCVQVAAAALSNAAPAASPLSTVLLACADGVLRLLSDLASVAVVGARVSSLDARDWHGGGLVACCGQFEGVLVATRAGYMLQPTT